jgi:hypothetical protein
MLDNGEHASQLDFKPICFSLVMPTKGAGIYLAVPELYCLYRVRFGELSHIIQ